MIPFTLTSPETGNALRSDTPHSLRDAETGARWPVIDGIPYLRIGRDGLIAEVLAHLDDAGAENGREKALVALLADQDDWWNGPPADPADLAALVHGREEASLRDAVRLLGWGRVGDYFLHRWSDPTFLAGLALLEAHWNGPACVFEFACGIGHYLRELRRHGAKVAGADVVFAKLWVARHWVVGRARSSSASTRPRPTGPSAARRSISSSATTPSISSTTRRVCSNACARTRAMTAGWP
nr:hypothetical protein [Methylobacterium durans]